MSITNNFIIIPPNGKPWDFLEDHTTLRRSVINDAARLRGKPAFQFDQVNRLTVDVTDWSAPRIHYEISFKDAPGISICGVVSCTSEERDDGISRGEPVFEEDDDTTDEFDEDDEGVILQERAQLAGMERGTAGYNEAMGYDTDDPGECGHHCDEDCPRCGWATRDVHEPKAVEWATMVLTPDGELHQLGACRLAMVDLNEFRQLGADGWVAKHRGATKYVNEFSVVEAEVDTPEFHGDLLVVYPD